MTEEVQRHFDIVMQAVRATAYLLGLREAQLNGLIAEAQDDSDPARRAWLTKDVEWVRQTRQAIEQYFQNAQAQAGENSGELTP